MTHSYFTDRDLGKSFPATLRSAGLAVEAHHEHFPPICPDETWLEEVGRRGWIAITHDKRIRYKPNELAAVVRHKVRLLVVIGDVPFAELAANFIASIGTIENFLRRRPAPFIAKIYRPSPGALSSPHSSRRSGRIELWYP